MLIPEKKKFLFYDKVSTSFVTKCLMAGEWRELWGRVGGKLEYDVSVAAGAREARAPRNVEGAAVLRLGRAKRVPDARRRLKHRSENPGEHISFWSILTTDPTESTKPSSTCASEGAERSERSECSVATERVHGEIQE
ncbi:hypothetical protein GPALN_001797 [Globodera pallida]|nr:hypothetical protein GPALN_001797 [Globodera pallida]